MFVFAEPWHAIIPQLFARLNHPEEYVRRTLVRLIARIGESGALRLVAYPAIVGEQAAHQEDRLANIRRLQQDPSQELSQSMAESSDEEKLVMIILSDPLYDRAKGTSMIEPCKVQAALIYIYKELNIHDRIHFCSHVNMVILLGSN